MRVIPSEVRGIPARETRTGHTQTGFLDSRRLARSEMTNKRKMKFSVNWLREFVELPPSIDALAELLTMSGVEIEGIEKRGADFDNVVVAQITDSKPHPNADRLTVCVVDDGSGTKRQIVCGAKITGWATKFR